MTPVSIAELELLMKLCSISPKRTWHLFTAQTLPSPTHTALPTLKKQTSSDTHVLTHFLENRLQGY